MAMCKQFTRSSRDPHCHWRRPGRARTHTHTPRASPADNKTFLNSGVGDCWAALLVSRCRCPLHLLYALAKTTDNNHWENNTHNNQYNNHNTYCKQKIFSNLPIRLYITYNRIIIILYYLIHLLFLKINEK